jgi:hypothetical protein
MTCVLLDTERCVNTGEIEVERTGGKNFVMAHFTRKVQISLFGKQQRRATSSTDGNRLYHEIRLFCFRDANCGSSESIRGGK